MAEHWSSSLGKVALLAAPMILVAGWLVSGFLREEPTEPSAFLAGFAPPEVDLPADRLHERVDGAADALRARGCERLLAWSLEEPRAELEVLVFRTAEGAGRVFASESGGGSGGGPGEESSVDNQAILFRRGRHYVRLIADPAVPADAALLLAEAHKVDGVIPRSTEAPR